MVTLHALHVNIEYILTPSVVGILCDSGIWYALEVCSGSGAEVCMGGEIIWEDWMALEEFAMAVLEICGDWLSGVMRPGMTENSPAGDGMPVQRSADAVDGSEDWHMEL